jgi:hypothetical protein
VKHLRRFKFRPLLAALLAMTVLASPVMSAEACALACAAGHEGVAPVQKTCCATKHAEHRSKEQSPSKSDSRDDDCGQCTATCCRPVTTVADRDLPMLGEAPALSVEQSPVAARDFVSHNLIFHPPRA